MLYVLIFTILNIINSFIYSNNYYVCIIFYRCSLQSFPQRVIKEGQVGFLHIYIKTYNSP